MTIERFLERYNYEAEPLGYIPNKTLAKVFKRYKYIDIREYWFDDPNKPDTINWEDIEGIGYGWIWLRYRKRNKELRHKALRKYLCKLAVRFHTKEPVWFSRYENVTSYLWSLGDEIIVVNLSNEELDPW